MIATKGYAVDGPKSDFSTYEFTRRDLGANDILIDIEFCGICHSDIHQARDEWGGSIYPMVPGHEIVGRVSKVGPSVSKFSVGDIAGIGCFVDSCRQCVNCRDSQEQFCTQRAAFTYNSLEMDKVTPTYGGYSKHYVVDEAYALKVDAGQPRAAVAPLLCAGITLYSPLKRFGAGPGKKVGIVGLGGLGHMGVKIAAAMGAEVTVFSTSPPKEQDALALGAHHFVVTRDPENLKPLGSTFDLIIDTVSADHDIEIYLKMLRVGGSFVLVGLPENPLSVPAFALANGNRNFAGSSIGGIAETQEMLDFCATNNITADVEVISMDRVPEAYERTIKADVRYRFVIDLSSFN